MPQKGAQEMLYFVAAKFTHIDSRILKSTNDFLTHISVSDFRNTIFFFLLHFFIKEFKCNDDIKINILGAKCAYFVQKWPNEEL